MLLDDVPREGSTFQEKHPEVQEQLFTGERGGSAGGRSRFVKSWWRIRKNTELKERSLTFGLALSFASSVTSASLSLDPFGDPSLQASASAPVKHGVGPEALTLAWTL